MQSELFISTKNTVIVISGYILWFLGFVWMAGSLLGCLSDMSKSNELDWASISTDILVALVGYVVLKIGKKMANKKSNL